MIELSPLWYFPDTRVNRHIMSGTKFTSYMADALALALEAQDAGEVPVGAVIVHNNKIVGRGHNLSRNDNDPSAHAEIVAIREAAKHLQSHRLDECDLWVTLEPCAMCAGAISHARIKRLYYGAADPKGGAVDSGVKFFNSPACHHKPEVYAGIDEDESGAMLRQFFEGRR